MKKVGFIILLTIVMRFNSYAQSIVGTWKVVVEKDEIVFEFDSSGYCAMQSDGEIMGGKMFVMDGKKYFMKYTINSSVIPFKLDMILFDYNTRKEIRRMLAIFSFIGNNKLNLCLDTSNNKRPKEFKSNDEDCFKLNRTK